MTQTPSFVIVNDSGAAVRARITQALAALASTNAGPSPPTATTPGMLWLDTSANPPEIKRRNGADDAWLPLLDGGEY